MSTPTEWTAQRLSDYADGYEFARQEILEQGEEMWWCEVHSYLSQHERGRCGYSVMKLMQIIPEQVGGCRITAQWRIPSAVVDLAKNEEEK